MLDDKNIVSEIASLPINIFVSYFICLFAISPNKVDMYLIHLVHLILSSSNSTTSRRILYTAR